MIGILQKYTPVSKGSGWVVRLCRGRIPRGAVLLTEHSLAGSLLQYLVFTSREWATRECSRFLMAGNCSLDDCILVFSLQLCVRLKQCFHLETFSWPTKAMFHKVGSILAQEVSGDAVAFCCNVKMGTPGSPFHMKSGTPVL